MSEKIDKTSKLKLNNKGTKQRSFVGALFHCFFVVEKESRRFCSFQSSAEICEICG
jgi:hypothetical protein